MMSPLSQCLPTTRLRTAVSSDARFATVQVYSASYRAVRMLSLMPPSTLTYVRTPGISLMVPTE